MDPSPPDPRIWGVSATVSGAETPQNGWTPVTFDTMWRAAVAGHADRVFLRFEDRNGVVTEWTYGAFDRIVEGATRRLVDEGVHAGAGVHLALANSPTFVVVWLAAVRLGAWIVPSDPMAAEPELTEHFGRTRPVVGFAATERFEAYAAAGAESPRTIIDIDESDTALAWLKPAPPVERPRPALTGRAAVMFTSGTTGRPKGVEITQANYAFAGATMAAAAGLTASDRQLVVLPMFHANAQYYSFASAIAVGASVALMPAFSARRFEHQAAAHQATCASLFAGPMRMILARGTGPDDDDPPLRLRHCWFAQNLTPAQYDEITTRLGCRPRQLYGMTETIPAVVADEPCDPRCDTMGYVTDGCIVDVRNADGTPASADADGRTHGEIMVGGRPGLSLFAGYLDDPVSTAASFRGEWFATSDRATRDADGRFRFTGRHSDVVKVAGENVSLVEVEQVLARHPDVADVAVVGAPDPVRDEVPVAFVVPRAERAGDDELRHDLDDWCTQRLAKAKRPRDITFLAELPRTSVGKIRKYVLMAESGKTER